MTIEILKKKKVVHSFRALKSFFYAGREIKQGETVEVYEIAEQAGLFQRRMVTPIDLPEIGRYVALADIVLPGHPEKHACEARALIELKAADATELMLKGLCIPYDPDQWRPFNRRFKTAADLKQEAANLKTNQGREQAANEEAIRRASDHLKQLKTAAKKARIPSGSDPS